MLLLSQLGLRPVRLEQIRDPLHDLRAPSTGCRPRAGRRARARAGSGCRRTPRCRREPRRARAGASATSAPAGRSPRFAISANHANIDADLGALLEQPDHLRIRHLRIPDDEGLSGPLDECRQLLPGVFGAHDKTVDARLEFLAQHVRFEQPERLIDEPAIARRRRRGCGS